MLNDDQSLDDHSLDDHQRFKELGALANSGSLNADEWLELQHHLLLCNQCREIHDDYQLVSLVGMPFLAANYAHPKEREHWDDTEAGEKFLERVRTAERQSSHPFSTDSNSNDSHSNDSHRTPPHLLLGLAASHWVRGGIAACLGLALIFGAYKLGSRTHAPESHLSLSPPDESQQLVAQKKSSERLLESQAARLFQIQEQNARQEQEVAKLRAALRILEDRSRELGATAGTTEAQLRAVSGERDILATQLQQAEQAYQGVKTELTNLRAEHDRALLHTASLESRISDLTAANRDQERRLGNDEQYLSSDRDIRELMGARKLYIADVFDVDSGSRTRKPFGRVFYTQNKSLIFYAFDLDHQAGVKNAGIFQVWGQKDAELSEKARPMNLGVLYMDSESNRRWVLRLDDSKHLAEIDAVFVTVEPHIGSPKPTGKPFLYALLRKEANHP